MSDEEATGGEFFKEEEAERREETRARLDEAAQKVAERLRTDDVSVVERAQALGFDGETARVLDLIPMVHVAWADGKIQKGERESILNVLQARGVNPGSDAFVYLESLLEKPPSEQYISETLSVIKDMIGDDKRRAEVLVDFCFAVAEAAGGFLGFGNPIDPKERAMLEKISSELGERAQVWLKAKFGEL